MVITGQQHLITNELQQTINLVPNAFFRLPSLIGPFRVNAAPQEWTCSSSWGIFAASRLPVLQLEGQRPFKLHWKTGRQSPKGRAGPRAPRLLPPFVPSERPRRLKRIT